MKYDFDQWRKNYDTATMEDQIAAHDEIGSLYPDQAHFDLEKIKDVLLNKNIKRVVEAGPWKGDLAHAILSDPAYDHIVSWIGIEICQYAKLHTVVSDGRFVYYNPSRFDFWNEKAMSAIEGDIFIGTHFIEHLSDQHMMSLACVIQGYEHIYFEAPITLAGQSWDGYEGTHMLTLGWDKVLQMFPFHICIRPQEGDSVVYLC